MFEKVNPAHPDKVADRIAGAIVDLAYKKQEDPKVACEVLIGHGVCHVIVETSVTFDEAEVEMIVNRIAGGMKLDFVQVKQDIHLAGNQQGNIRCGDNGIFKGVPVTGEQRALSWLAREIYKKCPYDGKYIVSDNTLVICQSNDENLNYNEVLPNDMKCIVNPLGYWTGGTDVDTGATNRKLGSDMGDSVTGGGLHGKDLSKADVSVNVYAWLKAQASGKPIELFCAIGDEMIDGRPYCEVVDIARSFIAEIGGFEKFAEWGLIG